MRAPSKDQVKRIWKQVCKQNNVSLISLGRFWHFVKRAAVRNAILENALDLVFDDVVDNWFFYLQFGRRGCINIPSRGLGTGDETSRIYDLATLAHELTHRAQCRPGVSDFYFEYALKPEVRAIHEAYAMASEADVLRIFGIAPKPYSLLFGAGWQKSYFVTPEQASHAQALYEAAVGKHAGGYYATKTGAMVCRALLEVLS